MSYLINKSNGEALVVLEDGTLDISTSLGLVGRNYVGYGEIQNENFVFLLENFANSEAPTRPLIGQLWFDSDIEILKVYNGSVWSAVGSAQLNDLPPSEPQLGSLWFDTSSDTLNTWTGSSWQFIGPESAGSFGTTRAKSDVLVDDLGQSQPVVLLTIDEVVIGIISNSSFRISKPGENSISGFLDIVPGVNISGIVNFKGDLIGTASRASILATSRTINGVGFDGSQDITITANTPNLLMSGAYILGNNFDGSQQSSWEVDASSANLAGKVVARDANGNFSANSITADLIGNVTGNINSSGTSNFNIVTANEFRGSTLSGNAFTATKLRDPVTINTVEFDGSQNIEVPAASNMLLGDTLSSNVKFSNIESLGILQSLRVNDSGITIGGGEQLEINLFNDISPQVNSIQGTLRLSTRNEGLVIIVSETSGTGRTSILPLNENVDFGRGDEKFGKIYSEEFIGDLTGTADSSISSTTSSNLAGGGTGAIPYQTSAGVTSFVASLPDSILKTNGEGIPVWGDPAFAQLTPGNYINGFTYTAAADRTWDIDATVSNTADKIVVRDSSGDVYATTFRGSFEGTSTTQALSDNSSKLATTAFVKTVVQNSSPLWAGATTLTNVISTYSSFPVGTRVSFWEERTYSRSANSNGGSVTISDRYRRTVEKAPNGTWFNIG